VFLEHGHGYIIKFTLPILDPTFDNDVDG